ncbi:hypothetical protein N1851_008482 [Merluccius polli]|uniref:Uncharacterized protein n=1 Tax=Merluccius polli TaxID=89951 RepID=A0AA47N1D1_MERPO|nr:hypothetical protein N1851_008482 [Merluccius polli]
MRSYTSKQGYSGTECIGEVVNRLLGRARDVTRVWLRSNPDTTDVNVVYSVLRRHFGDVVHSDLPLADFYAVQPLAGESPLNYWVRLNKSAEVTEQCLVSKGDKVKIQGMLDSGSMATSLRADLVPQLREAGVVGGHLISSTDIILIGCGGKQTEPVGICEMKLRLFDSDYLVPVLIVDGQVDEMIVGTNLLKPIIKRFKSDEAYWRIVGKSDSSQQQEASEFIRFLANLERWRGDEIPDRVGTVKLKQAVALEPMSEHVVWGRLPKGTRLSVGSAVIVEPSSSRCVPRNILVGRVVTPLWGDGWVPVKIINPTTSTITLRRNAKVADVSSCIALEDFDDGSEQTVHQNVVKVASDSCHGSLTAQSSSVGVRFVLRVRCQGRKCRRYWMCIVAGRTVYQ